ncbi:hypothetical protein HC723_09910 [Vibrio sp. S11_S32]|uniref:hypothetical protein n=1 Tax=Vibrio sp. S11_S32 TaxID=2720225 RepID=UPI0016815A8C|nr:hypothetical protein [Vibrio sp. S11_S32]MBD1576751.1 hypothetical protein [Vibrio sp. S11_S32]
MEPLVLKILLWLAGLIISLWVFSFSVSMGMKRHYKWMQTHEREEAEYAKRKASREERERDESADKKKNGEH